MHDTPPDSQVSIFFDLLWRACVTYTNTRKWMMRNSKNNKKNIVSVGMNQRFSFPFFLFSLCFKQLIIDSLQLVVTSNIPRVTYLIYVYRISGNNDDHCLWESELSWMEKSGVILLKIAQDFEILINEDYRWGLFYSIQSALRVIDTFIIEDGTLDILLIYMQISCPIR